MTVLTRTLKMLGKRAHWSTRINGWCFGIALYMRLYGQDERFWTGGWFTFYDAVVLVCGFIAFARTIKWVNEAGDALSEKRRYDALDPAQFMAWANAKANEKALMPVYKAEMLRLGAKIATLSEALDRGDVEEGVRRRGAIEQVIAESAKRRNLP